MPVMDGYEAMKEIKSQDNIKEIPIIALTAKAMTGSRKKCLEDGANDYISKPLNINHLFSIIDKWINH